MIFGPETWCELRCVVFTYWDRWLLRLAVDDPNGMRGVAMQLEQRRRTPHFSRDDTEAKLAQLADLASRLQRLGVEPHEVLGNAELVDKRLMSKAYEKVFRQTGGRFTQAMCNTPRRRLRERAMRGYWNEFPLSPSVFERELLSRAGGLKAFGWQDACCLADAFEIDSVPATASRADLRERLAFQRAAMTVIVELMDNVDGALAERMGVAFSENWGSYWTLPWERSGISADVFFRDIIEFTVWEDYGLVDGLGSCLRGLARDDAFVVENVFADVVAELREGGFEHHEDKALCLRVDFLVAAGMHDRFVEAAAELGSRAWMPIVAMAEASIAEGKRALALAIFGAADQPGIQRQHLREKCLKLTGEPPVTKALRRVK